MNINSVEISGKEVLPIIEGGKGSGATNGISSGAFAFNNSVGTFSGVNAERYDENGNVIPQIYHGKTRRERHDELIQMGIEGGIQQAEIAYEKASGKGRIHMNILWEMGGAEKILHGVLEKAKDKIHGITCGAGMPYRLSEIAAKYDVYYLPIVSSMRAFRALWKRAYQKTSQYLSAVVYEDPWKAGGHNGLSNAENPEEPQDPYPRVALIRKFMNEVGLNKVPIIMAGGVWKIKEWKDWLDNKEIGPIAFQFGTRPLVTKESPIPESWKKMLLNLKKGDVKLHKFSPTGFYSSAANNNFLEDLYQRSERQVGFAMKGDNMFCQEIAVGSRQKKLFVKPEDIEKINSWQANGQTEFMKTPDETIIFVTPEKMAEISQDQKDCMGCLSHCTFSSWKDHDNFSTGRKVDPRSFCIQKTLQNIITTGDIEHNLAFAGHNAYRFSDDALYKGGYIPSVKELIEKIKVGE